MRKRAVSSSFSKLTPVSMPIWSSMNTRSSLEVLPDAPGANGQPPMPPQVVDTLVMPERMAVSVLTMPMLRVS